LEPHRGDSARRHVWIGPLVNVSSQGGSDGVATLWPPWIGMALSPHERLLAECYRAQHDTGGLATGKFCSGVAVAFRPDSYYLTDPHVLALAEGTQGN
jgi:hypothetical protein